MRDDRRAYRVVSEMEGEKVMPDCDWCGEPTAQTEAVEGYTLGIKDTHVKCQRAAERAHRRDARFDLYDDRPEREPFNDWPNGQGTYD